MDRVQKFLLLPHWTEILLLCKVWKSSKRLVKVVSVLITWLLPFTFVYAADRVKLLKLNNLCVAVTLDLCWTIPANHTNWSWRYFLWWTDIANYTNWCTDAFDGSCVDGSGGTGIFFVFFSCTYWFIIMSNDEWIS